MSSSLSYLVVWLEVLLALGKLVNTLFVGLVSPRLPSVSVHRLHEFYSRA